MESAKRTHTKNRQAKRLFATTAAPGSQPPIAGPLRANHPSHPLVTRPNRPLDQRTKKNIIHHNYLNSLNQPPLSLIVTSILPPHLLLLLQTHSTQPSFTMSKTQTFISPGQQIIRTDLISNHQITELSTFHLFGNQTFIYLKYWTQPHAVNTPPSRPPSIPPIQPSETKHGAISTEHSYSSPEIRVIRTKCSSDRLLFSPPYHAYLPFYVSQLSLSSDELCSWLSHSIAPTGQSSPSSAPTTPTVAPNFNPAKTKNNKSATLSPFDPWDYPLEVDFFILLQFIYLGPFTSPSTLACILFPSA